MPDIARLLDTKFCRSSFEDPIVDLDGWRLFMDGFIPAANNLRLVGKILAWNKEIPRMYVSLVGFEDGAYEYQKGADLPIFQECAINYQAFRLPQDEMLAFVRSEVNKALARLIALLTANHGIEQVAVEIPDYSTVAGGRCLCCGQVVPMETE